jgi:hypothetical protein
MDGNGSKKDNIFIYQSRPYIRQIQAQFVIAFRSGNSNPYIKMASHYIKRSGKHEIEMYPLTSWDSDRNQQIRWNEDDTLHVSESLADLFRIEHPQKCSLKCKKKCCSAILKASRMNKCSTNRTPVGVFPTQKYNPGTVNPFGTISPKPLDITPSYTAVPSGLNQLLVNDYRKQLEEQNSFDPKKMEFHVNFQKKLSKKWNSYKR